MSVGQEQPSRRPWRGNGLPAESWVAIADLDPQVADDVLITLHSNQIGAHLEPTPATSGGFPDLDLPPQSTDRLFVDAAASLRARELVALELDEARAANASELLSTDEVAPNPIAPDEEHFQPPSPPPLPRLRPSTVASLALMVLGGFIILTGYDGGEFNVIGVIALFGGVVSLVWHMQDKPPTDSGWDDGAVL